VDPEAIVRRVWPAADVTVETLGGGITNHNFKVTAGPDAFVLRVAGAGTELLGIDRGHEEAAARMAAGIGVGPEVVDVVRPEGFLITRFIQGEPIPVERMREPEMLAAVTDALGRVHRGPAIPGRFDAHRVVEAYRDGARGLGVPIPDDCDWALGWSRRIEAARGAYPSLPCHNDLLNANFLLEDGRTVRIVDWEYAGMGDPYFDLGNFAVNHGFDVEDDERLLAAYTGRNDPADLGSLRLMRFMSDFREAMWGVVQQGVSQLDVDFVAYAADHFERLRATASDPRFETWLDAAARANPLASDA
jgi:aminoglycoside phosphotransferase (APT) family kinase protein